MRRVYLFCGVMLAAALLGSQSAVAQTDCPGCRVSIDRVDGLFHNNPDSVRVGIDVRIVLRYQNDFQAQDGVSIFNGLRVYSPDLAVWDTTLVDSTGYLPGDVTPGVPTLSRSAFDLVFNFSRWSTDGILSDTIGIAGQKVSLGLPKNFNDTPYVVIIRNIHDTSHGRTICIDSSWYRPAGTWKWTGGGGVTILPAWSGERCFTVIDPVTLGVNERPNTNLPKDFALGQNFPNPFNPSTVIDFDIPVNVYVRLDIYNVLGQKVRTLVDEELPAKKYSVDWDGTTDGGVKVASGIYFYKLEAGAFTETRKMVMLK